MNKIIKICLLVLSITSKISCNSKQSNSLCCSATVYQNGEEPQKIMDVRIGESEKFNSNKSITFYKKPKRIRKKSTKYVKYQPNLDHIEQIIVNKKIREQIDDKDFIGVTLETVQSGKLECFIQKNQQVIGKLEKNGIPAVFPINSIEKVVIENCELKDCEL